ncbi:MAG: Na+/H+ antiporter NhaC family protein, partial [Gemmatimonadota bacterium]
YLADSTSAPICVLVPFNAWGAYILGILAALGIENSLEVLVASIPFNVYPLAAIALAGFVATRGTNIGPMRAAEERTRDGSVQWPHAVSLGDPERMSPPPADGTPLRARNMVVPLAAMVLLMPVAMYATGSGDIMAGEGARSVMWSVLGALLIAGVLSVSQRLLSLQKASEVALEGAAALTGMALVLLLAIALGEVTKELGTGEYVASLVAGRVPLPVLLPLLFGVAAVIAFSTGSSWGTFAIMLPISVPIAVAIGAPVAPFVAVSLSGGIFGDHSSPISDTTIVASLASASDHIEHVRTQLPYALLAAAVAIIAFVGVGVWLSV